MPKMVPTTKNRKFTPLELTIDIVHKNRVESKTADICTALLKINIVPPFLKLLGHSEMCPYSIFNFKTVPVTDTLDFKACVTVAI